jgi:2-hydroxychromene-2-carboxylate isomerase
MRFRELLNAHGVTVEIIPFFLGAARDSVGNPFSPTPKAKEAFGAQDSEVTGQLLGLKIVRPNVFPILSLFVSLPHAARHAQTKFNDTLSRFAWPHG